MNILIFILLRISENFLTIPFLIVFFFLVYLLAITSKAPQKYRQRKYVPRMSAPGDKFRVRIHDSKFIIEQKHTGIFWRYIKDFNTKEEAEKICDILNFKEPNKNKK
jgi:hypothetical protein